MMPSNTAQIDDTTALRVRLAEAEDMLRAIRQGEIDALVVEGTGGNQIYTLHSAEEPYRNFVEQMQDGAVALTGQGTVLYANASFAKLVGEPLESIVGSRIDRFVKPSERGAFEELIKRGKGRCRSTMLQSGTRAFGVRLSLAMMASSTGEARRLHLIVTDLSELLEATSSLDRAERESHTKDDFLATLAHELRTPLSTIGTAVRVLESAHVPGTPEALANQAIARQLGHISHLVSDLLDVERVVSGKVRLNRQPLDMAATVRHVVATFSGRPDLDRQIEVSTESLWVDCDAVRLDQVLINLMTNAVKYTPPGGRIHVDLRADGDDAVLTVEDTGVGISSVSLPFIFDMYVQAGRTLDRAQGGLGIGLTLVRRLVELHGGTVAAASDGEGRGSTFTVRLKQVPALRAFSAADVEERRARPRRVLLIEDSADAREMLRTVLELAGHMVYDAADGVRGLELLSIVRPDVGIIDIGLPGMDGYQVAEKVREEPYGRDMLLLALTGYDPPAGAQKSEYAFDHHLVKPVDFGKLTHLLSAEKSVRRARMSS